MHGSLGREFKAEDPAPYDLDVRIPLGVEPAAQGAQRCDDLAAERRDRRLGRSHLARVQTLSVQRAPPQRKQHQIDVEPRPVLERDQRIGHAGTRIEGQRKAPERLSGKA